MDLIHWILIPGGALFVLWAVVRWKRSDERHRDFAARRDVALLSVLLMVGLVGDAVRTRFPDVSVPFLAISLALIPVAIWALAILFRLFKAYRRTGDSDSARDLSPRARRE